MECGAKRQGRDERCKAPAMANGRCRVHGGATPIGVAAVGFRHGRYSKHLPTRLRERYFDALTDKELLVSRDEIAVAEARLAELLERVDQGESGLRWKVVREAWSHMLAAINSAEPLDPAMREMEAAINAGVADYAAWREVERVLALRHRLAEGERRRLAELQQTLTVEQALVFMAAVMDLVREEVDDDSTVRAIAAGLQRLSQVHEIKG